MEAVLHQPCIYDISLHACACVTLYTDVTRQPLQGGGGEAGLRQPVPGQPAAQKRRRARRCAAGVREREREIEEREEGEREGERERERENREREERERRAGYLYICLVAPRGA